MSTQLDLDFADRPASETEDRLRKLIGVLQISGRWETRRELERLGFSERELRELVEQDREGRVFSYPGSPGYKLFDLVTDAEFDRCTSLRSQGEKMVNRFVIYQRRWHRRGKTRGGADAGGG
jgi:hypothetical protein